MTPAANLEAFVLEVERAADQHGVSFALGAAVRAEDGGVIIQVSAGRPGPVAVHPHQPDVTESSVLAAIALGALFSRTVGARLTVHEAMAFGRENAVTLLQRGGPDGLPRAKESATDGPEDQGTEAP
ncbi:MAG: hypothetical protein HOW73_43425 [Polyangiaceae bacterium]|nr:hypothetical protein [Polyangiaceae bacterium]